MIDPVLALQTAIHDHLVGAASVTTLVDPLNIRVGSGRPENLPSIMIHDGTAMMHGRAAGNQFVASVFIDLHVWALEDGLSAVKQVGAAVAHRLMTWPATSGFSLDDFRHDRTVWPRDPDRNFGHGVLSVEAAIRWSL